MIISNQKKRILFHLPVPIKADSYDGTQGRVLAILKYFRDRKDVFAVDVIAGNKFDLAEWTTEYQQEILKFVDNIFVYQGERNWFDFIYTRSQSFYYQSLLKRQLPVDSDYATPPGYIRFLRDLLTQRTYDFFWINNVDYAHLSTNLDLQLVTILDIHDIASRFRLVRKNIDYAKHLKFDYESNFRREVNLLNKFDAVVVDSQFEKKLISIHLPQSKLNFIPTPIETSSLFSNLIPYSSRNFEYDLLFVGAINQPNKDGLHFFLDSVFPHVLRIKPETRFAIAGKISSVISIDESLKDNVVCLGYVDSLSELYLMSRLFTCPLITGTGTKFKLIEAMAYAIPIVTTHLCASALSLTDGINALVTDDPTTYAEDVLGILAKPDMATLLSNNVATTFSVEHSSSAIYPKLDTLFASKLDTLSNTYLQT